MNKEDITLDILYSLLMEENPLVNVSITEEGNFNISGPTNLIENQELMEVLAEKITQVVQMSIQMGLYLPSELTAMLEDYIKEEGEK